MTYLPPPARPPARGTGAMVATVVIGVVALLVVVLTIATNDDGSGTAAAGAPVSLTPGVPAGAGASPDSQGASASPSGVTPSSRVNNPVVHTGLQLRNRFPLPAGAVLRISRVDPAGGPRSKAIIWIVPGRLATVRRFYDTSLGRLGFAWTPIKILLNDVRLVGWFGPLDSDTYLGSVEVNSYSSVFLTYRIPAGHVAITLLIRDASGR